MAKGSIIKIGNNEHWLIYNAEAYFQIIETMGEEIYNQINDPGPAGWDATVKTAAILLEQGELYRRYLGYDRQPFITAEGIRSCTAIDEIVTIKNKVLDAMLKGAVREVPDESPGEIDIGLQELEENNETKVTRAHYIRLAGLCGIGMRDAMMENPGLMQDIIELYTRSRRSDEDVNSNKDDID